MNKASMIGLMMTLLAASMPLAVAHDNCASANLGPGIVSGTTNTCADAHGDTLLGGGARLFVAGHPVPAQWNVPNHAPLPDCFIGSAGVGPASADYGFCVPLDLNGPVLVSAGGADVYVGSERIPVRWLDIENPLYGILP